jgi:hypothetical protein
MSSRLIMLLPPLLDTRQSEHRECRDLTIAALAAINEHFPVPHTALASLRALCSSLTRYRGHGVDTIVHWVADWACCETVAFSPPPAARQDSFQRERPAASVSILGDEVALHDVHAQAHRLFAVCLLRLLAAEEEAKRRGRVGSGFFDQDQSSVKVSKDVARGKAESVVGMGSAAATPAAATADVAHPPGAQSPLTCSPPQLRPALLRHGRAPCRTTRCHTSENMPCR